MDVPLVCRLFRQEHRRVSKYEAGLKIRSPLRVVIDDDLDRLQV